MSMKMKFGSKDIPFVYKGDKLVYPNPIKDGLLLWYDFKGMRNTDTNKEVAKDLSGNGNDGTLTNFNFTEGSGYKDNTLVFDGVDDSLTIPELELDETAMSVVHDGKLYAYEDDKVVAVGEDGSIEVGGRNLVLDSGIRNGYILNASGNVASSNTHKITDFIPIKTNTEYIFSAEQNPETERVYENMRIGFYDSERNFLNVIYIVAPEKKGEVFTTPENAHFTRISVGNYPINLMLMKGSVPMDYQPAPEDFQNTSLSPASLTDLQLYNKTLNKTELLYNAESKGLKKLKPGVIVQDGLVLHYDFSHESNTSEYKGKAFDYSGNGNHGELQNFNFTEESGYEGSKLKFDGVDDYVQVPELERTNEYSLFMTLLKKKGGESSHIVGFSNGNTYFRIEGGVRLYFFGQSHDGVKNHYSGLYSPRIFETDFEGVMSVGLTVNRDTLRLFFNGEQVGEEKKYDGELLPLQLSHVGRYQNSYSIYPTHSTKFYNRPLTPEEISHNYQIEKERFHDKYVAPTNLPIGQATIGSTFIIGGNKK